MKIAIIGSGISGLAMSYLLNQSHDITLYEKNHNKGGHSRTIDVNADAVSIPVDTGFIVYNEENYFHLTRLFRHLGVPVEKSTMSFGVSIEKGLFEYASTGLFAQKRNLLRPCFWGMVLDIVKFNHHSLKFLEQDNDISMGEYLDQLRVGRWFRNYYLLAMGAAIWSCSTETILKFPARSFLQFFKNHGLLTINGHPQWYTVKGGSREYVDRLTSSFKNRIKVDCAVLSVKRDDAGVVVLDVQGNVERYDKVVFACHADETLSLLDMPTDDESEILGAFSYQPNTVYLHSDTSFMPRRRACWSSWVYLSDTKTDDKKFVSLSYWMNNLQPLNTDMPVFVTLNPGREPDASLTHDSHVFSHPVFDGAAIEAQKKIHLLQGKNHTYFCGAYQRYGFHEDGLLSAVNVAHIMNVSVPWI